MLKISLLIPFGLQQDDQPIALASRRTEALFVYLLRTGQPQAREVLANLFWDDLPQTQAGGNLRVLIANLHKAVGPYVTITRQSVAFDHKSAFCCDLTDLQQALTNAHTEQSGVGGLSKAGADTMACALAGYQGELLPGFYLRGGLGFDEWLATEREWLWTRAIAALSEVTSAYHRLGDYQAGIEQAQRLVKFDPLREESHQQLMKLLAANGQSQAALAHYQRCHQLLDKELGVPPSAATTQLFEQIQHSTRQKAPPSVIASPSSPTIPHNLPRETTPFIGRDPELERLRHYLFDPAYPLVTLVGEGGSGKTRLALAAARLIAATSGLPRMPHAALDSASTNTPHSPFPTPNSPFPDGIWFVALAPIQRSATALRTAIVAAIAKAMNFTFQGQRPVEQQLRAWLQTRRCLLLLDNFEQLIPAEAPETGDSNPGESTLSESNAIDFIIELLEQAPHLQLLVTSRIPLDLSSEFMVRLSGLPVPAVELPTDAATYASVRLFAERATRIADHFHLERELSTVAAICRFVAGLPLGIELAAAWSGSRTPIEILFALQANLDFLTTRRRDIPPRQRSMRAVFDHSWQLLAATDQHVLTQVACFKGGFTVEAVQAVLASTPDRHGVSQDVAKNLHSLVHQALLQQDATGRYSIHPLLHEYADEKFGELCTTNREIKDATTGVVQRCHSHYYLDLVGQASIQGWYTRAALAPIHADLDNVRQAWQWASHHDDLAGLTLGWLGLWHFYNSSALFQEGEEAFRTALEQVQPHSSVGSELPSAERSRMVMRLQIAHASFLNALGRHREAVAIAQSATAFAEAAQDDALKARGYAAWGTGLYRQGQYPAALALLGQGLRSAQKVGLMQLEASLHKRLANTLQVNHDFDQARSHYAEALALYRQDNNPLGEGEALNGLGWCLQQQHDLPGALAYLRQAEQIQQAIANPHGQSMSLINLAVVYEQLGDYSQAFACRRQVLELLKQVDDPYHQSLVNHGLGVLLSRLGDYTAAEPYYLRSLEIDRALGDCGGVAWTQNNLGLLYNHQGNYGTALALHQEALQTSLTLGARTTQGLAWSRLGQDYYGLGELEAAYDAYLNAITIQTALGQQVWAIESKSGLAATQLALHMREEALTLVQEILSFLAEKSLNGAREPMLVYWNCYQVLNAKRDPRATVLLHTAHQQLTEQAAKLADQKLQRTFLENVRPHHALQQAYHQP